MILFRIFFTISIQPIIKPDFKMQTFEIMYSGQYHTNRNYIKVTLHAHVDNIAELTSVAAPICVNDMLCGYRWSIETDKADEILKTIRLLHKKKNGVILEETHFDHLMMKVEAFAFYTLLIKYNVKWSHRYVEDEAKLY